MRWFSRVILASFVSTGLALVLSMFTQSVDSEFAATSSAVTRITEQNLVDYVSGIKLHSQLARVDWSEPTLALDLKWHDEEVLKPLLFDDYAHLIASAFIETDNVDQVLIRVVKVSREHEGSPELIEWLKAERRQFKLQDYFDWLNQKITADTWIQTSFTFKGNPS